jgi:hypothetical protein
MKTTIRTLGLATSMLFAASAGAAYKCVDEKGFTRFGDTPPEQCGNVVMYEVSTSGSVIRRIEPSLTPDQVKAKDDEVERRKESDKVANEQKRKDLALLATFSSEGEFDTVRDRNIDPLKSRIQSSNDRLTAIDKRLKELDDEMEFYKSGKSKGKPRDGKEKAAPEAPPMLVAELQRLKHERETVTKNLVGYDKEIAALKSKFDIDKKRWIALKSGAPSGEAAGQPAPAAESKPEPKTAAKAERPPARKAN